MKKTDSKFTRAEIRAAARLALADMPEELKHLSRPTRAPVQPKPEGSRRSLTDLLKGKPSYARIKGQE